jgi:hypothetical protein
MSWWNTKKQRAGQTVGVCEPTCQRISAIVRNPIGDAEPTIEYVNNKPGDTAPKKSKAGGNHAPRPFSFNEKSMISLSVSDLKRLDQSNPTYNGIKSEISSRHPQ